MAQQKITDVIKDTLIIFDGATGTELYARGIFTNRCYEELNLTDKKLVAQIENEYLDAGAEVITTNTFGANPLALEKFGLRDKTAIINKAGVEIAREAIAQRNSSAWADSPPAYRNSSGQACHLADWSVPQGYRPYRSAG